MSKPVTISIQLESLNLKPLSLAKFFYQKGIDSHLFIQKLIYFAFLEGLRSDLLLFSERFQAWKHGPVLVSVFEKVTGCSDLDRMFQKVPDLSFSKHKQMITILESIHQEYQDWEVWDLVDKSHQGPWEKARVGLEPEDTSTNELNLEELVRFANALRPKG